MELKHQNISAVLKGVGETWITGDKPAFNFPASLEDAVLRWLQRNPAWLARGTTLPPEHLLQDEAPTWTGAPPTLSNQSAPKDLDQMLRIARKFDVAGRDALNRALGRPAEERVLRQERAGLRSSGCEDLVRKARLVSEEDDDGTEYDIARFMSEARSRQIEVKTTKWQRSSGRTGVCSGRGTLAAHRRPSSFTQRSTRMCR